MTETKSTCCYCGVGCGVIIEHDHQHITGVRGDPDHPANVGKLCIKGATLHLSATPELTSARALVPEMRQQRHAPRTPAHWDDALEYAANRFADIIREHGPDSVAFYLAGQLLTEDYYVFNKLAKGLIGTNNLDTNSRLCMSSAVVGYKLSLGMDSVPCCYEDIDAASCLFISGSNAAFAHPIVFRRIEKAKAANPALKIIAVDPRRTDTTELADLHLAILPGTDIALYNGLLHIMLWEGWVNEDYIATHTEGFDALKKIVRTYTPAAVAEICGIAVADLELAAQWFATSPATLSLYCQGLNQSTHGAHNNSALINLHLATAQIGRPGAGPFSLTGQPNAMGGREVGGLSNLLSAHRDMSKAEDRAEVAALWGIPAVPNKPGKSAVELFEALHSGEIKAIWIGCTNPAQSMPDQTLIHAALEKAEFVVVQEAYAHTETARYADVLLPATTWGEKEGVVTNSERRITRVRPAILRPGEARHDWRIARDFGLLLGEKLGIADTPRLMNFPSVESVFNEHRETTRGRDLDITGLSYELLENQGPQQWPFPAGASTGKKRLYEDGIFPTPSGKARFVATEHKETADKVSARFPLHLLTGRLRDQWHGMSRTGTVARLYSHESEPLLHMHPDDLTRRDLQSGELVTVKNGRGRISLKVQANDSMRPGQCYVPMHWGANSMSGLGVNTLLPSAYDPYSKQPELKHTAVQVEKLASGPNWVAIRRAEDGCGQALLQAARPLLKEFPFATLTLAGRDTPVVVFKAWTEALPSELIDKVDAALQLTDDSRCMSYRDPAGTVSKRALMTGDRLDGVHLSGETRAADWLQALIESGKDVGGIRKWLLAPLSAPPEGASSGGKVVCNCFNVSEETLVTAFAAGESLLAMQEKTQCGTNCGSCVPELKRLYQHHAPQVSTTDA